MSKDYYTILGVSKTANDDEIKSAYRNLAKQYHPDKNQGNKEAEEKFKNISEAYEVLKDPQKRSMYDQGAYNPQGGGNPFGEGFGGFGGGFGGGNAGGFGGFFEDIFEEMMGGGRGRGQAQQSQRGNDLLYTLNITLEEAFSGDEKEIKINKLSSCETCSGSGANGSVEYDNCKACGGRGKVRRQNGFFAVEQICGSCGGAGKTIKNPCKTCSGEGRVNKIKTLMVKIPHGIDNGMKIRLSNEGEAGRRGAKSGDLYIMVNIAPHSVFVRKSNDLFLNISIPMLTATLGGDITIKTIDNSEIDITIPEGIQSGQRIRIKEKGMKVLNGAKRGDLYVDVAVETPLKLSKAQKQTLKDLFPEVEKKAKILPR